MIKSISAEGNSCQIDSQKNQKFERIYVDFDELAKKDVNDIIKNYALLTKYKSRLK